MTNRIAAVILVVLLAAVAADLLANEGTAVMFTTRKFLDLVDWVAFWH